MRGPGRRRFAVRRLGAALPLAAALLLGAAGLARADQALFRISSLDAGVLAFDLSIVELKREPRVSELKVHGFNGRTEPGSRWLMCMFNTLAILRGFDYWTAVYPAGDDEIVLVGFPAGPRDKMADIDPRFASRWAMGVVAPIDRGVRLCKRAGG